MSDRLDLSSAPAYARTVTARHELRWRALELAALRGHPDIQWYLDRDTQLGSFPEPRGAKAPRRSQRRQRQLRRERWAARPKAVQSALVALAMIGLVPAAVVFLAPTLISIVALADIWAGIIGTASVASRLDGPVIAPAHSIPTSGLLMASLVLILPAQLALELHGGNRLDDEDRVPFFAPHSYLTATLCGPVTALGCLLLGRRYDVAHWGLAALASLAGTAVGLVCVLLRARAMRDSSAPRGTAYRADDQPLLPEHLAGRYNHLKPALRLIRSLDTDDRAAAQRELETALTDLNARGLLTEEEATRAATVGVGLLAAEMPNLRRERVTPPEAQQAIEGSPSAGGPAEGDPSTRKK